MATQAHMATRPTSDAVVEQKLHKLRELYADAPEVGKVALQHGMADIAREFAALTGATGVQSAGRVGSRQGNPNLTVAETRRLGRVGKAVDEFLDQIS